MRVIFLDIDGVLNSEAFAWRRENSGAWLAGGRRPASEIDPLAVEYFAKLVEQSKAKIVISSSWRIVYTLEEIKQAIDPDGRYPSITENIIGETVAHVPMQDRPTMYQEKDYQRGYEIAEWLANHTWAVKPEIAPEIEGYVILDDGSDMAWLMDHLVQTSWQQGFLPEHIEKALAVLAMPVGKVWP